MIVSHMFYGQISIVLYIFCSIGFSGSALYFAPPTLSWEMDYVVNPPVKCLMAFDFQDNPAPHPLPSLKMPTKGFLNRNVFCLFWQCLRHGLLAPCIKCSFRLSVTPTTPNLPPRQALRFSRQQVEAVNILQHFTTRIFNPGYCPCKATHNTHSRLHVHLRVSVAHSNTFLKQ